jgi:hypothetical protein
MEARPRAGAALRKLKLGTRGWKRKAGFSAGSAKRNPQSVWGLKPQRLAPAGPIGVRSRRRGDYELAAIGPRTPGLEGSPDTPVRGLRKAKPLAMTAM